MEGKFPEPLSGESDVYSLQMAKSAQSATTVQLGVFTLYIKLVRCQGRASVVRCISFTMWQRE
jgi:hypothetical protein